MREISSFTTLLQWAGGAYSAPGPLAELAMGKEVDTRVSHINENDWLENNMTDWRLEVDLASQNDWRRLELNMTGGGDLVG